VTWSVPKALRMARGVKAVKLTSPSGRVGDRSGQLVGLGCCRGRRRRHRRCSSRAAYPQRVGISGMTGGQILSFPGVFGRHTTPWFMVT
jgi:hypothetical protein